MAIQREIKFRAWLKEEKQMVNVQELLLGPGAACITHWIPGNKYLQKRADQIELMQFTGLHDKNGKEIYEGDIVKHSYPAGHTTYQVKIGEFDNGEEYDSHESGCGVYLETVFEHYFVERWKDESFDKWFKKEEEIRNVDSYPSIDDCEVIGNIYENPELLSDPIK